jgi:protein TonB
MTKSITTTGTSNRAEKRTVNLSISANDRFGLTFLLAAIFHGLVILGITFTISPSADNQTAPSLDIILVQTQSPNEIKKADYLAQVSQQGGGKEGPKKRARELFSAPTLSENPGIATQNNTPQQHKKKQSEELSLLSQNNAEQIVYNKENPFKTEDDINLDNIDAQQNMQTARLAAEISNTIEEQTGTDKILYLNSSTKEFTPAKYMHNWISRVERIGNLNYPDQARRDKLSGTLILDVVIDASGKLIKTDLRQSSGHQILDDAAKRIVKLAAPYPTFPKKLRQEADVIHITRSWEFLNNSSIRTR